MKSPGLFKLTFDPQKSNLFLTPKSIPWPEGKTPVALKPVPPKPNPTPVDPLSVFFGYDAVVVTWTVAEAQTLARLFTPGVTLDEWENYNYNVDEYIPLVTGHEAPFNDKEDARYYQSLAKYYTVQIGKIKVLVMKSGLHLAYDGPATPVDKLMAHIAETVNPKVFITTGTGGAIGADVMLGDVVVAQKVLFDCTGQFKNASFAGDVFTVSKPSEAFNISPDLFEVNASRIPDARAGAPEIWNDPESNIVTTDEFAFDDSTDYYGLQGKGRCCDMGDAMVANALSGFPGIKFFAVRNASDPQIDNPTNNMRTASQTSEHIYAKYGGLTTAASVIVTWALILMEV